ncbi:sulfatase-like hydrolase/transferase [Phyllobacterium bourgognense]|uniref:Sulfatase-like protein n=1 Tax=Phyllobacterium bourgognense TaxID=314236 RepID=A0A368YIV7_9HYPH|nr:sulfatase-like hydrolase/transferase [Phyllobacterium bourgognense]RCW80152.1 sulfatase-like protein [Phyllobacterium bourgognense]
MKIPEKADMLYVLMLPIFVFYTVPVYIIFNNPNDFQDISASFTLVTLAATAAVIVIAALILVLFVPGNRIGKGVFVALRFVFFFLLLSGLVLPLTKVAGQIEVGLIPINAVNFFFAFIGALLLTFFSMGIHAGKLLIASLVFVALNTIVGTAIILINIAPKSVDSIHMASSMKNVFVLSFDGLSRDISLEVLRENPEYLAAFKDFTFFQNALSSAPATIPSIASELSGIANVKVFDTEKNMKDAIDPNILMTNRLDQGGFVVSTYGPYNEGFEENERKYSYRTLDTNFTPRQRIDRVVEIQQYAMARMLSSYLVFERENVDPIIAAIGYEKTKPRRDNLRSLVEYHKGVDWDRGSLLTMLDVEDYITNIHVGTQEPVAHFVHFLQTHFPVDFDETCAYRSDDAEWFRNNQNRVGATNETKCAFSQFARFVGRLRELGIYDMSMIIIKSDHGQPVAYNDPDKLESFKVKEHPYWGFARYTPLLGIKNFAAISPAPTFDERVAVLTDLAKTLCLNALKPTSGCDAYSGFDLLDKAVMPADSGTYLYLVKDASSTFYLDSQEAIDWPRQPDFYRRLNDKLSSSLLTAPLSCSTEIDLSRGKPYSNGLTDGSTWVQWYEGTSTFVKTRIPHCDAIGASITLVGTSVEGYSIEINGSDRTPSARIETNGKVITMNVPISDISGKDLLLSVRGPVRLVPSSIQFAGNTP